MKLKYNHPAVAPLGIDINKIYDSDDLINNFKLDKELIDILFISMDEKKAKKKEVIE